MFAVQAHLVLNHVPLSGLMFGLVFYTLGIKKSSEAALFDKRENLCREGCNPNGGSGLRFAIRTCSVGGAVA